MVLDEALVSGPPVERSPASLLLVPGAEMLFLRFGGEDVHFGFRSFFELESEIVGVVSEEKLLDFKTEKSCFGPVVFALFDSGG